MGSRMFGICIVAAQTNEFNLHNFAVYTLFFVLSMLTTSNLISEKTETLLQDSIDLMQRMITAIPQNNLLAFAENIPDFNSMKTVLNSEYSEFPDSEWSELLSTISFDLFSDSSSTVSSTRSLKEDELIEEDSFFDTDA